MSASILIQIHRHDSQVEGSKYTLNSLIGVWRHMGLSVRVQSLLPPLARADADVAINHVCRTATPAPYLRYLSRFPVVVNGGLTDTSKQLYNSDLVSLGDAYDGPVIVKTKLNSGGANEHKHAGWLNRYATGLRQLSARASGRSDYWATTARVKSSDYPVFDRPSLVPPAVWSNPYLIVQRYMPELEGDGRFRLRSWYLFGDKDFHVVTRGKHSNVKGVNIIDRWVANDGTPPELVAIRNKMQVDYARFDYVVVGGKAVVFDINRTPKNSPEATAKYAAQWGGLAEGIGAFLR